VIHKSRFASCVDPSRLNRDDDLVSSLTTNSGPEELPAGG